MTKMQSVTKQTIEEAATGLKGVAAKTDLYFSERLSHKYNAKIYIKREDLQIVRSFKIRGAYNKINSLSKEERNRGVVCASAGNHAQGVAYSCAALKVKGVIYMPITTPNQKVEKVRSFGKNFVTIKLEGDSFDEANRQAQKYCKQQNAVYVHPFDDPMTISGQGTVGKEIYEQLGGELDIVISCIGGGGLISGVSTYLKGTDAKIKVFGSEPAGAASMKLSLKKGAVTPLEEMDKFVDGAAVSKVGDMTFQLVKKYVDKIFSVEEGRICTNMIELYQNEGIIAEPAGALSISALEAARAFIKGKTVVCILSGGNNDIMRYPEIMEKSLIYEGLKHYFIVDFPQKPGELKKFVTKALGKNDDISRFEYIKKTNKEKGPALVGIELQSKDDYKPLLKRLDDNHINFREITNDKLLFDYLV